MLEARTYRMKGHAEHDSQAYVPKEELEDWKRRDPIERLLGDRRFPMLPLVEVALVREAEVVREGGAELVGAEVVAADTDDEAKLGKANMKAELADDSCRIELERVGARSGDRVGLLAPGGRNSMSP